MTTASETANSTKSRLSVVLEKIIALRALRWREVACLFALSAMAATHSPPKGSSHAQPTKVPTHSVRRQTTVTRVQPRAAATAVIEEYLVDANGMLELPIDPVALAKDMGIRVTYSSTLEDGVSGVIVKEENDNVARIYLNSGQAEVRQRFTCAHEIGHFRSRQLEGDSRYGFVDKRDDLSSGGHDPAEIWANQFAAELLMPAAAVRKFFADGMKAGRLAREFGVSEAAMSYRLSNLYLV